MSDHPETVAALVARVNELEAENERLTAATKPAPDDSAPVPRRSRWRPILSATCIVLASILVPVSIAGAWVRAELVDTDRFVATIGPIVDDPAVQELLIDRTTSAIDEQLDIEAVTNDLFDGLQGIGLPPRAAAALDLLRGPAAQGVQGLVEQVVTRLVTSEAFAEVFERALRASHRGMVAAATGGQSGAVSIDESGTIGIELGPIIAEVKARLVDRGVGLAASIPEVDRTIPVAQVEALPTVRVVYGAAVTVGWWLPFVALALFAAGVLIARRRTTALLGSGVGLAFGGAILATTLAIVATVLGVVAGDLQVPSSALLAIYGQVVADMRQTAIVGLVLGVVVAVFAWSQGRWRGAVAVRRGFTGVNDAIRGALAARGVGTGSFGRWMERQRVLVRVIITVLAVVWLWLLRPLGVGEIAVVLIVALLVWWVCELLRSRVEVGEEVSAVQAEPAMQMKG